MKPFEYDNPVKVIFGPNVLARAGEEAAQYGKKALLVTYADASFFAAPMRTLEETLQKNGVACVPCCCVTANPTLAQAREGIRICLREGIDVVIGLGGGSVMDCAKIIAAGAKYPYPMEPERMIVFTHKEQKHILPTEALPSVMIPTLPATGSEMNSTAVVTDEKTRQKSYVFAPCLYPKAAVMDPALTVGLPPYQTACGGIDIIAHVMEAYCNGARDTNLDLQDGMQEGVIRAVWENLPPLLERPDDLQRRGVLMWAASIALNGWLTSGTMGFTPMHQMGHVLSAQYNATHGATLACMMPAWMRFFAHSEKDRARYEQFAERLFHASILEAADQLQAYIESVGVESRLRALGVKEDDIPFLAGQVARISFNADGVLGSDPAVDRADVEEIFRLAM